MMSPGLTCQSSSGARPRFSRVPGRKFSKSTSASWQSSRNSSRPRGDFRSSVTHFFPRDCTDHHNVCPCTRALPHSRIGSGRLGASILITSAPKSASWRPAKGPAIRDPSSRTRTPAKGPTPCGDSVSLAAPGSPPRVAVSETFTIFGLLFCRRRPRRANAVDLHSGEPIETSSRGATPFHIVDLNPRCGYPCRRNGSPDDTRGFFSGRKDGLDPGGTNVVRHPERRPHDGERAVQFGLRPKDGG